MRLRAFAAAALLAVVLWGCSSSAGHASEIVGCEEFREAARGLSDHTMTETQVVAKLREAAKDAGSADKDRKPYTAMVKFLADFDAGDSSTAAANVDAIMTACQSYHY